MRQPRVTIVVSPREQFRLARPSLESIYARTRLPFTAICVDGGSPRHVRRYLEDQARRRRFSLIRTDHYLCPNEARRLALPRVDTEYACFVDNDVIVTPGWLEALVRCADETGAWAVGPLYCNDDPAREQIHMAGGLAHFRHVGGRRAFLEEHRFAYRHIGEVRAHLRREPTELVEYHCMLVRTETFDRFGPPDVGYLSAAEHIDLCLRLREAGCPVYLEPAAIVSSLSPPPFAWSDLPFYLLRWSDAWNRMSLRHFRECWDLPPDDGWLAAHYGWLTGHRDEAFEWLATRTRRGLGWRRGNRLARAIIEAIHRRVVARDLGRRPELVEYERGAPAPVAAAAA